MLMLTEPRRRHQNPQELGVQVTMSDLTWELGNELGSFTREVHAFNQCAILPALHAGVCIILNPLNIRGTSMLAHLKMLQSESLVSRMSPSDPC